MVLAKTQLRVAKTRSPQTALGAVRFVLTYVAELTTVEWRLLSVAVTAMPQTAPVAVTSVASVGRLRAFVPDRLPAETSLC